MADGCANLGIGVQSRLITSREKRANCSPAFGKPRICVHEIPTSLKAVAVIELIAGILVGLLVIILLAAEGRVFYREALVLASVAGLALWFLCVSGLWLFGSPVGAGLLTANTFVLVCISGVVAYFAIEMAGPNGTTQAGLMISTAGLFLLIIFLVFHIASLFSRPVKELRAGSGPAKRYLPYGIAFFTTMFLPIVVVATLQVSGSGATCRMTCASLSFALWYGGCVER